MAHNRTQSAGERIRAVIDRESGWDVEWTWNYKGRGYDTITVCHMDSHVKGEKLADIINTVLTEIPSLEVESTLEGYSAVRFRFANRSYNSSTS